MKKYLSLAGKYQKVFSLLVLMAFSCDGDDKNKLLEILGVEKHDQLMKLSLDEFDQSPFGFRKYAGDYDLVQLLIPEYIRTNQLSEQKSRNLHWHLGQIHAFNENYQKAIRQMEQSYAGGSDTWKCYVDGSIAFLKEDKGALMDAVGALSQQDNQMNLEFLEKFVKYFDLTYTEAYNADL